MDLAAAADAISSQPANIYQRWQQEAAPDNIMTVAVSNCSYFQGSVRLTSLSFLFFLFPSSQLNRFAVQHLISSSKSSVWWGPNHTLNRLKVELYKRVVQSRQRWSEETGGGAGMYVESILLLSATLRRSVRGAQRTFSTWRLLLFFLTESNFLACCSVVGTFCLKGDPGRA